MRTACGGGLFGAYDEDSYTGVSARWGGWCGGPGVYITEFWDMAGSSEVCIAKGYFSNEWLIPVMLYGAELNFDSKASHVRIFEF